ncbi:MAG: hypothetical protein JSW04_08595 [Desulfobacterales bacterium]|nr:MAG: hypothetical protein JSW04_08595 [Desulfobacterales bacterium]
MGISAMTLALIDNGGRRLGIDRRQYSYTDHIPNSRSTEDRRSGIDRRYGSERRNGEDRRSDEIVLKKIKRPSNDMRRGVDRRVDSDRRAALTAIKVD